MYFSRVRIDTSSLSQYNLVKVLQGDNYAIHQLIWKLFPDQPDKKRDFLFRQEFEKEQIPYSETRRGMPIFYIVSHDKPVSVDGLLNVETKSYSPKLDINLKLQFDVRVNPVIQEKVDRTNVEEWKLSRKERGLKEKDPTKLRRYHNVLMNAKKLAKVEGVIDPEVIKARMNETVIQWLETMGERGGFQIENQSVDITPNHQHLLRKKGQNKIQFSSIDLSGVLSVTDVDRFRETLFNGLGHSKAFGCGMMMVKKIS